MITHQTLVVRRPAGADLSASEGCFVKLSAGKLQLTSAQDKAADVFGLLTDPAEADRPCDVALPSFAGIVGVRVSSAVADGDRLALDADGAVKKAEETATVVAVALGSGESGSLVEARLVEPADVKPAAIALAAGSAVKVAAAKASK